MNAIYYLFILIAIALGLFLMAYFLPKDNHDPLATLLTNTQALLADTPFFAVQEKNYIAIYEQKRRVALLQIDPKTQKSLRHFAGVIIICFYRPPSKKQLYKQLKHHQILTVN